MATAEELLTRGRDACTEHAWTDAYHALTEADELAPLDAADLDRLALAAHLTGRIESAAGAWERAHEAHAASQDVPGAVRSAFWMGLVLALRGEHARAGGWLARAQHMLEDSGLDCVEKGYLQLPAALQALGGGDHDKALEICGNIRAIAELGEIAARFDSPFLRAVVGYSRGCVLQAEGDAEAACIALRQAWLAWQQMDARYECARVRLRMGQACRMLNDHDTAEMELAAAREIFAELGAAPALDQVRDLVVDGESRPAGILTPRELEVLRLVATGATNRDIADSLVISEKTVARHLSNMLTKLDLPSRTAATAYAYQHDLV